MDHPYNTGTDLNLNLDNRYFVDKLANSDENNSFTKELFMNRIIKKPKIEANENDDHDGLNNADLSRPRSPEMEHEETSEHEKNSKHVFEIKNMIEKLKQDVTMWKEKCLQTENQLKACEAKLSENASKTTSVHVLKSLPHCNMLDEAAVQKELSEVTKAFNEIEKNYKNAIELVNRKEKKLTDVKMEMKNLLKITSELAETSIHHTVTEHSSVSQEEKSVISKNSFYNFSEDYNLPTETFIKKEIEEEELPNFCLNDQSTTNNCFLSPNMKYSNIKESPSENLHPDTENSLYDVTKDDKCIFQLPFSLSNVKNSSNEIMQNNKISSNSINNISVNSHLPQCNSFRTDLVSSHDEGKLLNPDKMDKILESFIIKDKDLVLMYPMPIFPVKKFDLLSCKINERNNYAHNESSSKNIGIMQKDISTSQLNGQKTSRLPDQTSSCFEPHIEIGSKSNHSSTNCSDLTTRSTFKMSIPPNLHYGGSSYINDNYQISYQGSGTFNYIYNPDTKFTAVFLTVPKSRNATHDNEDVLSCVEERKNSVLSMYNAIINPQTSTKKENLFLSENITKNSLNNSPPYFCVQIGSKDGQVNLTSNLGNKSASKDCSNHSLAISEDKKRQINLTNSIENKQPSLSIKEQSSEVMHNESYPKSSQRSSATTENYLDINLAKNSFIIDDNMNGLKKSLEAAEVLETSKYESNPLLDDCSLKSEATISAFESGETSEKRDTSVPKHSISVNKNKSEDEMFLAVRSDNILHSASEWEKKEVNFFLNANSLINKPVSNEVPISTFENDEISDKIIASTPKSKTFIDKNESEDEMSVTTKCNKSFQNNSPLNADSLNKGAITSEEPISAFENDEISEKITASVPKSKIFIDKNEFEDEMSLTSKHNKSLQNISSLNADSLNKGPISSEEPISAFENDEISDKIITSTPKRNSFIAKEDEMNLTIKSDENLLTSSSPATNEVNSLLTASSLNNGAIPNEVPISVFKSDEILDKVFISIPKYDISIGKNKPQDEMHTAMTCDNNLQNNSPHVKNETIAAFKSNEKSDKTTTISPKCNISTGKRKSEDETHLAITCDSNLMSSSEFLKNKIHSACNLNNETTSTFDSDEISDKVTNFTPKHFSIDNKNYKDMKNLPAIGNDNLQDSESFVKQNLLQDSNFKSSTIQSHKNEFYDKFDDSKKHKKELEQITVKHPCLSSEITTNSNPDEKICEPLEKHKNKLQHFSALAAENVFLVDTEVPACKKRKLSVNAPIEMFSKNELIETSSDQSRDSIKTITETSLRKSEIFQSSVHLTNHTPVSQSYGIFKKIDNFSSHEKGKKSVLYSAVSSKNIEKDSVPISPKSLNVNPNKNVEDLSGITNKRILSNVSQKNKKKNKKMKKKSFSMKDSSSFTGICPKKSKKACQTESIQNNESLLSGLQGNLKIQSSVEQLLKNSSKNSYNILTQSEIKRGTKSSESEKNNLPNFKNEIGSSAKVGYENTCDVQPFQNNIGKNNKGINSLNHQESSIQIAVHTKKNSESKTKPYTLRINKNELSDKDGSSVKFSCNPIKVIEKNGEINSNNYLSSEDSLNLQESSIQTAVHTNKTSKNKTKPYTLRNNKNDLTNKDSSSVKFSCNPLKVIDKNSKINSSDYLSSEDLLNHKEQCTSQSSSVTTPESNEVRIKNDLSPPKKINISLHSHEHSVKLTNPPVKDTQTIECDKLAFSSTFDRTPTSTAIGNSFENKVFDNSQNENRNECVRHGSYQSNISDDENPLVIVDDEDCNQNFETGDNNDEDVFATSENSIEENKNNAVLSAETKKSKKKKQKKRKKSKTPNANKRKKSQNCEEESICNSCTIEKALDDIKKMKLEEMLTQHSKYKLFLHKLIISLINPINAPSVTSALYQLFCFLISSKSNPLISYPVKKNTNVFFPPSENCIVDALLKIEKKRKIHLEGLIPSAITTLYYLILDKKSIPKTGLGALCRIFTQLCKHTDNKQKPIRLTCDLIKEQHPLAPVLIAFIIGSWVELFQPNEDTDECWLLHLSFIHLGLQKKPSTVTSSDWNACKAVFNLSTAIPLPTNLQETTDILITNMQQIVNDPPSEKDEWVHDQIIIFAVNNGWTWTEENIVNPVIDSLHYYAKTVNNERGFSFFAELCAGIGKLAPNEYLDVLGALSTLFIDNYGFEYVKKHAACNLLKLLLLKHMVIPQTISEYVQENANNLDETDVKLYLRRRCIADETNLTEIDIFDIKDFKTCDSF